MSKSFTNYKITRAPLSQSPFQWGLWLDEMLQYQDWVNEHFIFILPEAQTLDEILMRGKILVRRNGISGLIRKRIVCVTRLCARIHADRNSNLVRRYTGKNKNGKKVSSPFAGNLLFGGKNVKSLNFSGKIVVARDLPVVN